MSKLYASGPLDRFLVISDLQIPFEAKQALAFCKYVKRHFHIPDDCCLCVGDETDSYWASMYEHDPDAGHTPGSELYESREKIREWGDAFPKLKIATSNHGMRWVRKAKNAGIPTEILKPYAEIIGAPPGWFWKDRWLIHARHQFQLMHGCEYGGMYCYRHAALHEAISTVFGHLHTSAGIAHIRTESASKWGMCVGSLIEHEAYAFQYSKFQKLKPTIGVGVVLNGGSTPIWLPYDM